MNMRSDTAVGPDFDRVLAEHGLPALSRAELTTLQVNLGKRCNQACRHCHVDAGPARTEVMDRATAEQVLAVLAASPGLGTLDITGGAPELNPSFRLLVREARGLGRRVIDRCNLTVLLDPGQEDTAAFLAEHEVEVVASLPCYSEANVDRQRGSGVFDRSVRALRMLNELGYGDGRSGRVLNLVYNPLGPALPPSQEGLEADYKVRLQADFGLRFDRLYTITNMPIARFARELARQGRTAAYMALLLEHFNPAAAAGVMCRTLLSVGWDGRLYDCDFNQMLDLCAPPRPRTIWDLSDVAALRGQPIATGSHCLACTAGAGSSCGGTLA